MKTYFLLFAVLFVQNISNSQSSADFLNVETFTQSVQSQFVLFYAPWCRHCKELLPTWNQLADKSHEQSQWNMKITKVNCVEETAFCSAQNIVAYPTMKLFHDGDSRRFDGRRSLTELGIFIEKVLNRPDIEEEEGVLKLTSENFDAHIKQGIGLHFVDFYAPWCIHCKRFEPTWKAIAKHYKDNPDITIGKIDCTAETSKCRQWGIGGFPTLDLFQDGQLVEMYRESRDFEELKVYINNKLYEHGLKVDTNSVREAEKEKEPPTNPEEVVYVHSDMYVNSDIDEDQMNSNPVVELLDRTFDMLIAQETTFINFYTPWSQESKAFSKTWNNFGILCQKEGLTTIAQIDCSRFPDVCKRYQVFQYPTLILFKEGYRHHYKEDKSLKSLHNFVKQHIHDEL